MKPVKMIFAALVVALGLTAFTANAQFRFGPKLGMNVSKLSFDEKVFDSENRVGINVGAMAEFTLPALGVGVDLSVLYVRRNDRYINENENSIENIHRDYIDIPLNLKWKITIPLVSKILTPFITTGPDFAVLTGKRSFDDFRNKKCDISWNFGIGVELLKHLQVAGSYGLGLNKLTNTTEYQVDGKNRYWTVTAAYLF